LIIYHQKIFDYFGHVVRSDPDNLKKLVIVVRRITISGMITYPLVRLSKDLREIPFFALKQIKCMEEFDGYGYKDTSG